MLDRSVNTLLLARTSQQRYEFKGLAKEGLKGMGRWGDMLIENWTKAQRRATFSDFKGLDFLSEFFVPSEISVFPQETKFTERERKKGDGEKIK